MSNNLNKRVEAVEQAIGKLATPAQEAEIKAYCQQHGLKYKAGEAVIVVSIPDAAPDDPLLSHEDGTRHYAALEAMGANVLHFQMVYPDDQPPTFDSQYGKTYVGWSPDNWDAETDD